MNYRIAELKALESFSADKTFIIDIDVADPVSALLIYHSVTNGGGASADGHPTKCITKIEVVDGSEVLFGMDGLCTEALDLYENKGIRRGGWTHYLANTGTDRVIGIQFGRFLWDTLLALDPKQFGNLQLKISYDYTGAGGMAASANALAVHACLFDEKVISPVGFLMNKEVKSYDMAVATEYTDMPTDFPYRKLLIQAIKAGSEPNGCVSDIKLSEDQDKRIPVNLLGFQDIVRGIGREGAFISEAWIVGLTTAQRYYFCTPSMNVQGSVAQWRETPTANQGSFYDGDGGRFQGKATAANDYNVILEGFAPHAVACIPFGDQMELEDWYNVMNIGNLKLSVKGLTTSGTIKILTQQLRRY